MAFFQKGNAILYLFYVSLSLILPKLQTRMSNLQMTDRLSKVTEALTHPDSLKVFQENTLTVNLFLPDISFAK